MSALLAELDPSNASDADLAMALRYAEARVTDYRSDFLRQRLPDHVLRGQALLDLAVEWRMPEVERWAVAWLAAAGVPYLRTRWSSRSRNGRQRRDRRLLEGAVTVLAGFGGGALIGADSGVVGVWTVDGAIAAAPVRLGGPVLALAGTGSRIVAGGRNSALASSGWPVGAAPPEPAHWANISAICTDGSVVCFGQEDGRVFVWRGDSTEWTPLVRRRSRVLAVGLDAGVVRAVWADGVLATADSDLGWVDERVLGANVVSAAFDGTGRRVAYATGGERSVRLAGRDDPVWTHSRGISCLTWSPGGFLASAASDRTIRAGLPGGRPVSINAEGDVAVLAFAGDGHLISADRDRLVQWDLSLTGSDDPTFAANDRITAVALDIADRGYCVVGTRYGRLQRYDARGLFANWEPAQVGGFVHEIVRHRAGWLVAAQTGAFAWKPGEAAVSLRPGLCRAVASWGGRAVYAIANQVFVLDDDSDAGKPLITMPASVIGLATSGDTVAALANDGTLLLHGSWGSTMLQTSDDTLLAAMPGGALTLDRSRSLVWRRRQDGSTKRLLLSIRPTRLVRLDERRYAGAYGVGTAVIEAGPPPAYPPAAAVVAALPVGANLVAAGAGRVVTGDGLRLTGYDVMEPGPTTGDGLLRLRMSVAGGDCEVTIDGRPAPVRLPMAALAELTEKAGSRRIDNQSASVDRAGRLGDVLWFGGLDVELDRARGSVPDRPVRVDLRIREEDQGVLADVPWELLHPRTGPLCWFDDPPVSMVRVVAPRRVPNRGPVPTRWRMLVLRDPAPELDPVTEAYEELRRRTRRTAVTLLHGAPLGVTGLGDIREPAEVIHLWAHAGPHGVHFSVGKQSNDDVATALANTGARLIVLVGCKSSDLARLLVERGVEAVVGMRTEVTNSTVHTLVEEVTTAALRGVPVDQAFTVALRRYVLSGQPGAAAVPLLYLREGSSGIVFPPSS
jgi:hypothetical protein